MKNKFLITGACGFVSKYFVNFLCNQEKNIEIMGLDIFEDCPINCEKFKYKKVDMRDRSLLKQVLAEFKPDYILHLASISSVSRSWEIPVESFNNNTNLFLNLLESVRELGLESKILSVGSSEEYGNYLQQEMPLQETYQLRPNSPYAVARVSQELLSRLYAESYGLNVVMTRSFNHIGPEQKDLFVISSFVKQIVEISKNPKNNILNTGDIDVVRDFLDVRDVVKAYYKIFLDGKTGEIYNVCSGVGLKIRDVVEILAQKLKVDIEIKNDITRVRPTDINMVIGDNTKIKSELGWLPEFDLNQTLDDMISYWKLN